jgi:hypothetical protein
MTLQIIFILKYKFNSHIYFDSFFNEIANAISKIDNENEVDKINSNLKCDFGYANGDKYISMHVSRFKKNIYLKIKYSI